MRRAQQKPKGKELKEIYKGLMTSAVPVRVNTLKMALQWYDQALDFMKSSGKDWPIERVLLEDKMGTHRMAGVEEKTLEGKENYFRMALREAEAAVPELHPYGVDAAYGNAEHYKLKVGQRRERLSAKYGSALLILQKALRPVSMQGEDLQLIADDVRKGKSFEPGGHEIIYNQAAAFACQQTLRKKGLLALVVQEINSLACFGTISYDEEGMVEHNQEKHGEEVCRLLQNFYNYCLLPEAPRNLVKNHEAAEPKRQRRVHGITRDKIDGMYVKGSAAALVYESLKDGAWHDVSELQKGTAANVKGRLSMLGRHGRTRGWAIEWKRTSEPYQVRMVKH